MPISATLQTDLRKLKPILAATSERTSSGRSLQEAFVRKRWICPALLDRSAASRVAGHSLQSPEVECNRQGQAPRPYAFGVNESRHRSESIPLAAQFVALPPLPGNPL